MHNVLTLSQSRIPLLLLFASVLLLAGCRVDLKNEIWLNKDNSGKALILAHIEYASDVSEISDTSILKENVLGDYIDLIGKTKGASILSQDIVDNSRGDKLAATYSVVFKFDKVETLNKILAVENSTVVTHKKDKKGNSIVLNPSAMSIIEKGGMELDLSEASPFDINYSLILHVPDKIKASNAIIETKLDDKSRQWDFVIDDAWYNNPVENITIVY